CSRPGRGWVRAHGAGAPAQAARSRALGRARPWTLPPRDESTGRLRRRRRTLRFHQDGCAGGRRRRHGVPVRGRAPRSRSAGRLDGGGRSRPGAQMSSTNVAQAARDPLAAVYVGVGLPPGELSVVRLTGRDPALPSIFRVTMVASASIAAATVGAAGLLAERNREPLREVCVDALHAVVAFRSERHVRLLDGELGELWDPLAGDYRSADGWIRLHTNYPHHRAAALRVLGV